MFDKLQNYFLLSPCIKTGGVVDFSYLLRDEVLTKVVAGLLLIIVGWALNLPKKLWGLLKKRQVSKYILLTSFDEKEVLAALRGYVKAKCTSVDPASTHEMKDFSFADYRCLFDYVDDFIKSASSKHLIILADCGMGKTSFLINYFYKNKVSFFYRKRDGMILVSLSRGGIEDQVKSVPLEKRRVTVILFDALDEDPMVLGNVHNRIKYLFDLSCDFKAIIITCRSQFFLSDEEIPVVTGILRSGPTAPGKSKEYGLSKIYVAPFTDKDVEKYLRKEMSSLFDMKKRAAAKKIVLRVPYLTVRPMLLAHISDVISEGVRLKNQSDIYQAMVSAWVKREEHWVSSKPLLDFSKKLAFDLYLNRERRCGECCSPDEISRMAKDWKVDIKTEHLTGRSLLNRFADGNYKFAHRSVLEYFVSQSILSAQAGLEIDVTDQMLIFLMEGLGCSEEDAAVRDVGRKIKVMVVSPQVRNGFSVNYNIYKETDWRVNVVGLFGARFIAADEPESLVNFSDILQRAIIYAAPSMKIVEIRLHVSGCDENGYAKAFLSIWYEDCVVLSELAAIFDDFTSVTGHVNSDHQEMVFVGKMGASCSLEHTIWKRQARSLEIQNRFDSLLCNRNSGIAISRDYGSGFVFLEILSGAERMGPLSGFGIVSGGSKNWVSGRMFFRIDQNKIPKMEVGRVIDQLQPVTPASHKWPTKPRFKS